MERVFFFVSLLLLSHVNIFAGSRDVIPMSDITLGMTAEELWEKYPFAEYEYFEKTRDEIQKNEILFYRVKDNDFWDALGLRIEDSKIKAIVYVYSNFDVMLQDPELHNTEKMVEQLKPVFQQLTKQLGSDFEKMVIYRPFGNEEVRSALYVWKRENDVVTFLHTPLSLHKKNAPFDCQLTILSTLEDFSQFIAIDSLQEDELLWADAMGETSDEKPDKKPDETPNTLSGTIPKATQPTVEGQSQSISTETKIVEEQTTKVKSVVSNRSFVPILICIALVLLVFGREKK